MLLCGFQVLLDGAAFTATQTAVIIANDFFDFIIFWLYRPQIFIYLK